MWDEKGNIDELKPALVIKPIFGCEVYFTPDETLARDHKPELYHMILLAKDQEGYVNLMQTVSEAAVQGFYYKPRVTLDNLRRHAKGMICTSACIAGIIPKYIDRGDMEGAIKWAETFRDTFDPGDFYIEIQEHGITTDNGLTDEQMDRTLIDIAKQVGVKVIATNDFHYLRREDAPVQDVIMCIGMNAKVDDPNRMRMTGSEFYMKTEEEMRAMFPYCPEACDNTLEIADKCYVELDWDSIILPRFPLLDPGETHESQFRRECEKGLRQHYGDDWATREIGGVNIKERFEYEYKVICDKGFAAYFLIVAEYVQWAKDNGIGVGPGRGSAAGAIVAYAMNITAFDPLENGLMFERSCPRSVPRCPISIWTSTMSGASRSWSTFASSTVRRRSPTSSPTRPLSQAGHQRRRARSGLPGLHGPAPVQDGLERPQGQAQAGARKATRQRGSV